MGLRRQLHVRIDVRVDEHTDRLLEYLQERLHLNMAGVLRLALQRLAEQEGWRDDG